jgi:hypothetical protein
VLLTSGERFKVVLINNARSPSNRGTEASALLSAVFAVMAPYLWLPLIVVAR